MEGGVCWRGRLRGEGRPRGSEVLPWKLDLILSTTGSHCKSFSREL